MKLQAAIMVTEDVTPITVRD